MFTSINTTYTDSRYSIGCQSDPRPIRAIPLQDDAVDIDTMTHPNYGTLNTVLDTEVTLTLADDVIAILNDYITIPPNVVSRLVANFHLHAGEETYGETSRQSRLRAFRESVVIAAAYQGRVHEMANHINSLRLWVNNAASQARRYTADNSGDYGWCEAGINQFLTDIGARQFINDYSVSISITIQASSQDDADEKVRNMLNTESYTSMCDRGLSYDIEEV